VLGVIAPVVASNVKPGVDVKVPPKYKFVPVKLTVCGVVTYVQKLPPV
jgi:hypothetical protein